MIRGEQKGITQTLSLPFESLPFVRPPPPLSLSPVETPLPRLQCKPLALWKEVSPLLTKGAMEIVDLSWDQGGFYSHYFLATKRTFGFHPILNLHKGWWMVSLDLKNAYLYVSIHPSHLSVSLVCYQEPGRGAPCLSMEGSLFWLSHCPQSFYQTLGSSRSTHASEGMSDVSVHQWACWAYPRSLLLRQVTGLLAFCHGLVPLCMFRLCPIRIS